MATGTDAADQVLALLARGWVWKEVGGDVLVHPADHALAVRYDRARDALRMSPALTQAVALVIPPYRKKPRG